MQEIPSAEPHVSVVTVLPQPGERVQSQLSYLCVALPRFPGQVASQNQSSLFRKRKQENALSSQCKSQPEKAFLVMVWAHLIHPKPPFLAERIKAALRLSTNFEMVCDNMKQDLPLLFDQMKG